MKYYQRMKWWYYILLVVGIGLLIWGGLRFIPPLSEAEVIANVKQSSHLSSQGDWQTTYLGYGHWRVEKDSQFIWDYFSKTDTTVLVEHRLTKEEQAQEEALGKRIKELWEKVR